MNNTSSPINELNAPTSGVEIKLDLAKAPLLGETTMLNATVTVVQADVVNSKFMIELPKGLEFVSGDLSWSSDLIIPQGTYSPKESLSLISYVKAVQEGNWTIMGIFSDDSSGENKFKITKNLYVFISEKDSYISEFPPRPPLGCLEGVNCTTTEPPIN